MNQKKRSIEYRLLVQKKFDETLKKEGILFLLETTKQFTNFSYVIDVKESVNDGKIIWSLHGLRAPSLNMPATGTAEFQKLYFELPKKVEFALIKKEKIKAETEFLFSANNIKSSRSISSFLRIYVDPQEFEQKRAHDAETAEPKPDIHREPSKKQSLKKKKR